MKPTSVLQGINLSVLSNPILSNQPTISYFWQNQRKVCYHNIYLRCLMWLNVNSSRKVKKPIVKKWCYTPSENDGISDSSSLAQPLEICPRKCEQVPQFSAMFIIWKIHHFLNIAGCEDWAVWPKLCWVWVSVRSVRPSPSSYLSCTLWGCCKLWWVISDEPWSRSKSKSLFLRVSLQWFLWSPHKSLEFFTKAIKNHKLPLFSRPVWSHMWGVLWPLSLYPHLPSQVRGQLLKEVHGHF